MSNHRDRTWDHKENKLLDPKFLLLDHHLNGSSSTLLLHGHMDAKISLVKMRRKGRKGRWVIKQERKLFRWCPYTRDVTGYYCKTETETENSKRERGLCRYLVLGFGKEVGPTHTWGGIHPWQSRMVWSSSVYGLSLSSSSLLSIKS
jgi:hypothetical protein